jgi:hypothetical protein
MLLQGDIVLIGLREFQPDKADVIHKYTTEEARNLQAFGELPTNARINQTAVDMAMEGGEGAEEDMGFDFEDVRNATSCRITPRIMLCHVCSYLLYTNLQGLLFLIRSLLFFLPIRLVSLNLILLLLFCVLFFNRSKLSPLFKVLLRVL